MLFYWSAIFPTNNPFPFKTTEMGFLSVAQHTIGPLAAWVDFLLGRMPVRKFHFVYPVGVGVVYLVFNLIMTLGEIMPEGKPIYKPLTYRNVMSYVYVGVCVSLIVGGGFLAYFIRNKWQDDHKSDDYVFYARSDLDADNRQDINHGICRSSNQSIGGARRSSGAVSMSPEHTPD